jgi:endonuclease/exonuclease/phosphatase family metal-dependent hydrolase
MNQPLTPDVHRVTRVRLAAGLAVLALALIAACAGTGDQHDELRLTVMSFNVWGAGGNDGRSIDDTVAVIRHVNPDLVGLQEVQAESSDCTEAFCPPFGASRAGEIARSLGYYVYEQQQENAALWANAVISRFPIQDATPNELGVILQIQGRRVGVFNIHATDFPYQPYQALGIAYGSAPYLQTAPELVAAANQARGEAITLLLEEIAIADSLDVIIITGDFNEPSHRDWTERAAKSGVHPMSVAWPATRRLEQAGFKDTYRALFPDEIAMPGFTWTPTTALDDPNDHHDRIAYVFVRGSDAQIESAQVVGEALVDSGSGISRWPSDHRAVVARIVIP